jgi:hypothetical protein
METISLIWGVFMMGIYWDYDWGEKDELRRS